MGSKSAPAAPDYTKAAEATAASSKEVTNQQTWANRADQYSPWGSTTWNSEAAVDPATGQQVTKWTQNTDVSPELQSALDSQLQLQTGRSELANSLWPRAQSEFGQAMNWSTLPGWAGAPNSGNLQTTTNPYGFGPRDQAINTGLSQTPQLNADLTGSAGGIQRGLDYSNLQGVDTAGAARQKAEDALYQSQTARLDPQWNKRRGDMETDLANRGISVNSDAYRNAMDDFERQRGDAYSQAQLASITGAGAEAQRDYSMDLGLRQQQVGEAGNLGQFANSAQQQAFGQLQGNNQALMQQNDMGQAARNQQLAAQQAAYQQSLSSGQYGLQQQQQAFGQNQEAGSQNFSQQLQAAQFQNQMRQQQLAEEMQKRGFSLNEINAIISGQQVSAPQFNGYNQAQASQATNYSGAAQNQYSASMDAYNAKQQQIGNLMQGAGGMAMMFSDRRVKADIRRIGRHPRGFNVYAYRYRGERGRRVGVMAQEVRRVAPELVRSCSGVLMVDYDRINLDAWGHHGNQ